MLVGLLRMLLRFDVQVVALEEIDEFARTKARREDSGLLEWEAFSQAL